MPSASKREVLTIGIFGSNGKTSTVNMLTSILNSAGLAVCVICDENGVVHNRTVANIEVYKKLKNEGINDIIIVEITECLLRNDKLSDISFDMLVHTHISEGSYESTAEGITRINTLINSQENIKTVILNTDDDNWKSLVVDVENAYLITYGLGSKATVTASSIECSKEIQFCYCLQRALTNYKDMMIEPMEVPFVIKALGQHNVYNGLAVITVSLILGIDIDLIESSLCSTIPGSGLRVLYENGFGVVDNVCNNVLSFETGFEAVQNLPYENIILMFDLCSMNSYSTNKRILEAIAAWSLTLKMQEIYYFDCKQIEGTKKLFDEIKNSFLIHGINTIKVEGDLLTIEKIINSLKENDMLLFFCCKDMNKVRGKITEMLDSRILGNLSDKMV